MGAWSAREHSGLQAEGPLVRNPVALPDLASRLIDPPVFHVHNAT